MFSTRTTPSRQRPDQAVLAPTALRILPMRELPAISWQEFLLILGAFRTIWEELLEVRFTGPRALRSAMTTLSTSLSVTAALALHMDYVWWAAMSGFMATRQLARGPSSALFCASSERWPGPRSASSSLPGSPMTMSRVHSSFFASPRWAPWASC